MRSSGSQRPGLGDKSEKSHQSSRRSFVDFDSENLLSMQDIRENVRLTASKLLNDDLDSSDDEDYDDDQLPHAEDARFYATSLLTSMSKQPSVKSLRKPMDMLRSWKDMRKTSDPTFASDVADIEMELDDDYQRKRFSRHKIYCILASLAFLAAVVTIIVLFTSDDGSSSDGGGGSPPAVSAPPPPPPVEDSGSETEDMQVVIDFLVAKGVSDPAALNTEGSPQREAADWIANGDVMEYDIDEDESRIIQRYVITLLYFALDGPDWLHQLNFLSPEEVCSWYRDIPEHSVNDVYSVGITCNGYLQVETIFLRKFRESCWLGPLPFAFSNC